MKKIYFKKPQLPNILALMCTLFALASCSEKDIDSFDKGNSYIYFDIPYILAAQQIIIHEIPSWNNFYEYVTRTLWIIAIADTAYTWCPSSLHQSLRRIYILYTSILKEKFFTSLEYLLHVKLFILYKLVIKIKIVAVI